MPSGRNDHRNNKATAGSGGDRKTVQKKTNVSRIFIFVVIGIFAAVIGVSVAVIVGMTTGPDPMKKRCEKFFEIMKSGNKKLMNNSDIDIHMINVCETTNFNCNFDITTCQNPCPFGFDIDGDTRCYTCSCAQKGLFQGDMHFDENEVENMMELYGHKQIRKKEETFAIFSSALNTQFRWPLKNSRVLLPYETKPELGAEVIQLIRKTADALKEETCYDLVPKAGEKYFISFQKKMGCKSVT